MQPEIGDVMNAGGFVGEQRVEVGAGALMHNKMAIGTAQAQQPERIRHIAALMDIGETDSNAKTWVEAFQTQLGKAGWRQGRNCEIVYRWGASNPERLARHAEELLQSAPDVILVHGTTALIAQRKTNTALPIVFTACTVTFASRTGSALIGA